MARISCDLRFLLIPAAFMFIYIQVNLYPMISLFEVETEIDSIAAT
jgi:hypothetical protein